MWVTAARPTGCLMELWKTTFFLDIHWTQIITSLSFKLVAWHMILNFCPREIRLLLEKEVISWVEGRKQGYHWPGKRARAIFLCSMWMELLRMIITKLDWYQLCWFWDILLKYWCPNYLSNNIPHRHKKLSYGSLKMLMQKWESLLNIASEY